MVRSLVEIVNVTKMGQATIPKRFRDKYGIEDKALIEEVENGILLKPVPSPDNDVGSFKNFLKGRTAKDLLREARREEGIGEFEVC